MILSFIAEPGDEIAYPHLTAFMESAEDLGLALLTGTYTFGWRGVVDGVHAVDLAEILEFLMGEGCLLAGDPSVPINPTAEDG